MIVKEPVIYYGTYIEPLGPNADRVHGEPLAISNAVHDMMIAGWRVTVLPVGDGTVIVQRLPAPATMPAPAMMPPPATAYARVTSPAAPWVVVRHGRALLVALSVVAALAALGTLVWVVVSALIGFVAMLTGSAASLGVILLAVAVATLLGGGGSCTFIITHRHGWFR